MTDMKRAWQKADKEKLVDRDFIRGAICYCNGFAKMGTKTQVIATELSKAIQSYVKTGNLLEIDLVMQKRLDRVRYRAPEKLKMPNADLQHWVEMKTSELSQPVQIEEKKQFEDAETGMKSAEIPISQLAIQDISEKPEGENDRWGHVFDDETIHRMQVVHDVMKGNGVHWKSAQEFINGFYYDMNPYGELRIWEKVGLIYDLIFKVVEKVPMTEKRVFAALMMLSSNQYPEGLLPEQINTAMIHMWASTEAGVALKASIEAAHGKSVLTEATAVVTPIRVSNIKP